MSDAGGEFIEIPKTHLFSPADAAARELWARRFITEFTGVSRGLGHGVFHGGSLIRNIDSDAVARRGKNANARRITCWSFAIACRCRWETMARCCSVIAGTRFGIPRIVTTKST